MPNDATEMINNQIAREIGKLNSILTDEDEKPAIVQRIAELKAILDNSSSAQVEAKPQPTTRELIAEFITALRNR